MGGGRSGSYRGGVVLRVDFGTSFRIGCGFVVIPMRFRRGSKVDGEFGWVSPANLIPLPLRCLLAIGKRVHSIRQSAASLSDSILGGDAITTFGCDRIAVRG